MITHPVVERDVGSTTDPPHTTIDRLLEQCAELREAARDLAGTGCAAAALGIDPMVGDMLTRVLDEVGQEVERLRTLAAAASREQVVELQTDSPLQLNLGSGVEHIPGWVNVDLFSGDVIADLRQPLPFETGSASHIYAAHVLEHLRYPDEAWAFLAECRRVLRRGGRIRLVVPDMRTYIEAFCDPVEDAWLELIQARGWDRGESRLDALLGYAGASHHPGNFFGHHHGYDAASLTELVSSVGFGPVRVCTYQGSSDDVLRIDDRSRSGRTPKDGSSSPSLFLEAFVLF